MILAPWSGARRARAAEEIHDWDTAIALLDRARDGDRGALYVLVRLLCETGRSQEARRAVLSIAPNDTYAHHILEPHRPSPLGTT